MSFLKRMFAGARPASGSAAPSEPGAHSSLPATQQNAGRRETLRQVLRETLNRTGIPTTWLGADLLAATSRGREPGIHVRLLLRHWDPRLMLHAVAFEKAFRKRLLTLDTQADRWLLGFSWQFALPSDRACPPLPHPGTWTSGSPDTPAATAEAAAETDMTSSAAADLLGGSIVISGPATTPVSSAARPAAAAASRDEAKADLERLFAVRDEDLARARSQRSQGLTFAATEPAKLEPHPGPRAGVPAEAAQAHNAFAKTDIFRRPDKPIAPAFEPTKH